MTVIGSGGVLIRHIQRTARFSKDFGKLTAELQQRTEDRLTALLSDPRPPGLAFEKLKGYRRPDLYTLHVTGNYKLSLAIEGATAILRRIAPHDEIDRAP
jgi:plasmid maintenance system killer protein